MFRILVLLGLVLIFAACGPQANSDAREDETVQIVKAVGLDRVLDYSNEAAAKKTRLLIEQEMNEVEGLLMARSSTFLVAQKYGANWAEHITFKEFAALLDKKTPRQIIEQAKSMGMNETNQYVLDDLIQEAKAAAQQLKEKTENP